jgi:uncharacterized protein
MKKMLVVSAKVILILYLLICVLLYFVQEKLLFFPEKLAKAMPFQFDQPVEEKNIQTQDGIVLNGLLFKTDSSKGLVFYLHGNAGSLRSWGQAAQTYTDLGHDVFMIDYRGYGKSEGEINGQNQQFEDMQTAYDELKKLYPEDKITVMGYSMGTGLATKLAATNNPKRLILQAPFYSMVDMMKRTYSLIPTFILKYKFETNKHLKDCKMPVTIFHGDQDEVIYYGSSLKLQQGFKSTDSLITLQGQSHNGITDNPFYKNAIKDILGKD